MATKKQIAKARAKAMYAIEAYFCSIRVEDRYNKDEFYTHKEDIKDIIFWVCDSATGKCGAICLDAANKAINSLNK